jgi:hypothetical protein
LLDWVFSRKITDFPKPNSSWRGIWRKRNSRTTNSCLAINPFFYAPTPFSEGI